MEIRRDATAGATPARAAAPRREKDRRPPSEDGRGGKFREKDRRGDFRGARPPAAGAPRLPAAQPAARGVAEAAPQAALEAVVGTALGRLGAAVRTARAVLPIARAHAALGGSGLARGGIAAAPPGALAPRRRR